MTEKDRQFTNPLYSYSNSNYKNSSPSDNHLKWLKPLKRYANSDNYWQAVYKRSGY